MDLSSLHEELLEISPQDPSTTNSDQDDKQCENSCNKFVKRFARLGHSPRFKRDFKLSFTGRWKDIRYFKCYICHECELCKTRNLLFYLHRHNSDKEWNLVCWGYDIYTRVSENPLILVHKQNACVFLACFISGNLFIANGVSAYGERTNDTLESVYNIIKEKHMMHVSNTEFTLLFEYESMYKTNRVLGVKYVCSLHNKTLKLIEYVDPMPKFPRDDLWAFLDTREKHLDELLKDPTIEEDYISIVNQNDFSTMKKSLMNVFENCIDGNGYIESRKLLELSFAAWLNYIIAYEIIYEGCLQSVKSNETIFSNFLKIFLQEVERCTIKKTFCDRLKEPKWRSLSLNDSSELSNPKNRINPYDFGARLTFIGFISLPALGKTTLYQSLSSVIEAKCACICSDNIGNRDDYILKMIRESFRNEIVFLSRCLVGTFYRQKLFSIIKYLYPACKIIVYNQKVSESRFLVGIMKKYLCRTISTRENHPTLNSLTTTSFSNVVSRFFKDYKNLGHRDRLYVSHNIPFSLDSSVYSRLNSLFDIISPMKSMVKSSIFSESIILPSHRVAYHTHPIDIHPFSTKDFRLSNICFNFNSEENSKLERYMNLYLAPRFKSIQCESYLNWKLPKSVQAWGDHCNSFLHTLRMSRLAGNFAIKDAEDTDTVPSTRAYLTASHLFWMKDVGITILISRVNLHRGYVTHFDYPKIYPLLIDLCKEDTDLIQESKFHRAVLAYLDLFAFEVSGNNDYKIEDEASVLPPGMSQEKIIHGEKLHYIKVSSFEQKLVLETDISVAIEPYQKSPPFNGFPEEALS